MRSRTGNDPVMPYAERKAKRLRNVTLSNLPIRNSAAVTIEPDPHVAQAIFGRHVFEIVATQITRSKMGPMAKSE
jgi:hypothetical protein